MTPGSPHRRLVSAGEQLDRAIPGELVAGSLPGRGAKPHTEVRIGEQPLKRRPKADSVDEQSGHTVLDGVRQAADPGRDHRRRSLALGTA